MMSDFELYARDFDPEDIEDAEPKPPSAVYPGVLSPLIDKAELDNCWEYVLQTKSGQQFWFSGLEVVNANWVHLFPIDYHPGRTPCVDGPHKNPYRVMDRALTLGSIQSNGLLMEHPDPDQFC